MCGGMYWCSLAAEEPADAMVLLSWPVAGDDAWLSGCQIAHDFISYGMWDVSGCDRNRHVGCGMLNLFHSQTVH